MFGFLKKAFGGLHATMTEGTPVGQPPVKDYSGYSNSADLYDHVFRTDGSLYSTPFGLTFPAVLRGVSLISSTLAGLDFYIKSPSGKILNGSSSTMEDMMAQRVLDVLNDKPDGVVDTSSFFEIVINNLLFEGNAFLVKRLTPNDFVEKIELAYYTEGGTAQRYINDGYYLAVYNSLDSQYRFYSAGEVVHIRGPLLDEIYRGSQYRAFYGTSIVRKASRTVCTSIDGDKLVKQFFLDGFRSNLYVSVPGVLTQDQRREFASALKKSGDQRQPVILGYGMAMNRVESTPQTRDLKELREYQTSEVSRVFGVPLELMSTKVDGAVKIGETSKFFWRFCLRHWANRIEKSLSAYLLPSGYKFCYDPMSLLKGDSESQVSLTNSMLGGGQIPPWGSINEVRDLHGLPRLDGDKYDRVPDAPIAMTGMEGKNE